MTTTDPTEDTGIAPEDFAVLDTECIRPAVENRRFVDDERQAELTTSIQEFGILVPLLVRELPAEEVEDGVTHELIAGERRWTAARTLAHTTVPAIVLDYYKTADRLGAMWSENAHRRELSTMDRARHVALMVDLKLSQRDIADKLGMSQPQVSKLLSLTKLPEQAQRWIDDGELTQEFGVKLAGLPKAVVTELCAGGAPDEWRIKQAVIHREHAKRAAQARKDAEDKGQRILDDRPSYVRSRRLGEGPNPVRLGPSGPIDHVDREEHEQAPCHAVWIATTGDVVPACTDPESHLPPAAAKDTAAPAAPASRPGVPTAEESQAAHFADAELAARTDHVMEPVRALAAAALNVLADAEDCALAYATVAILRSHDPWMATAEAARMLDIEVRQAHVGADELAEAVADESVAGVDAIYAWGLALGLAAVEKWVAMDPADQADESLPVTADVRALLTHLDSMVEGVPRFEQLLVSAAGLADEDEAVTEDPTEIGAAAPTPSSTDAEAAEADDEPEAGPPNVTFTTKGNKVYRHCSACGKLDGFNTRGEHAAERARLHVVEEHGGGGTVDGEAVASDG